MDLNYPPEAEQFRKEIRTWLEENLPDGWFEPGFTMDADARRQFNEDWTRRLYEGGWICAAWPKEYGGKGLSIMENVVLAEEFARAGAPMRADFFGDTLVGPTILQWGTEEQKKEFLPKIQSGQIEWCQGFSEPDSGSDLASLKTTAVLDGDEWVINGQKVWTTQAQNADYIFLLARTDPAATKHKGISYLLVPMQQPGVEVRGITQPDGTAEFNEVFFDNVRAPEGERGRRRQQRLGRGQHDAGPRAGHVGDHELPALPGGAQPHGGDGPGERPRSTTRSSASGLARYHSKIQILRINGLRGLSATVAGKKDPDVAGPRGVEQDVLVGDASRGHGAVPRHLRRRQPADHQRRRTRGRRCDAPEAAPDVPGDADDLVVLLQPLRDDLGRDRRDPTQHRRRARPGSAKGAQGRRPVSRGARGVEAEHAVRFVAGVGRARSGVAAGVGPEHAVRRRRRGKRQRRAARGARRTEGPTSPPERRLPDRVGGPSAAGPVAAGQAMPDCDRNHGCLISSASSGIAELGRARARGPDIRRGGRARHAVRGWRRG